jgi:LacI family transcriptional regulator
VAERAGVATSTVSHVINGTRNVDPVLAKRVNAAIDELGYRPNAVAQSMRRGQTHTVGLIVPDIANPFFSDLARALEDASMKAGYSTIICNSDGDEHRESYYLEVLLSKKVDGLVLVGDSQTSDSLRHAVEHGPPTIVVDRDLDDLPVSQVLVDNIGGGLLAGHHLLDLGHRDIGVLAGPGGLGTSVRRLEGFTRALAGAGVGIREDRVFKGDFRSSGGRAAIQRWLDMGSLPTAVFAENDLMAIGALSAAHAAGVLVPSQMSVVGFDGIPFGADVSPALTTVAQPTAEMAAAAIEMLLERLQDGDIRKMEFSVSLLVRESSDVAPASDQLRSTGPSLSSVAPKRRDGGEVDSDGSTATSERTHPAIAEPIVRAS